MKTAKPDPVHIQFRIRAFDGYLVKTAHFEQVVSPAFDSLTPAKRHDFGLAHPANYINAMRSPEDFPVGQRPSREEVLQFNAITLNAMLDRGNFEKIEKPSIFVYRLAVDSHQQTAIICEIPIDHYRNGIVLKHEDTRSDKEDLLAAYLDVVGVSSSPACLAYPQDVSIDQIVESVMTENPVIDTSAHDQVRQTLWRISNADLINDIRSRFSTVERMYLTDGHHRFAAGTRYAEKRRSAIGNPGGDESFNHILVALFPAHQLRILSFNRCVRDLNKLDETEFLEKLSAAFTVEKLDFRDAEPMQAHTFGMCLRGQWYRLTLRPTHYPAPGTLGELDVSILQNLVLQPILGINDVRSDDRLDYISGDSGTHGLSLQCQAGWAVGFACYPTSIEELIEVANNGEVMPPKSTYFDPKMRSGIFLRLHR